MFITIHAAAATIIGKKINNVIIAFILGFVSHFLLDLIPHGDEQLGRKFFGLRLKFFKKEENIKLMALYASIDVAFLAIFLLFIFKNFEFVSTNSVIWTIIGGIIPDVFVVLYKLTKFKPLEWFARFHGRIHCFLVEKLKADIPLKYGVFFQTCLMILLIWLIYLL